MVIAVLAMSACGADSPEAPTQTLFGGDRPVWIEVPTDYDHATAVPLVFVLHGYGTNAFTQVRYTGLGALVEDMGAILVAPDGTLDEVGKQFWNATDECCDFYGTGVDDVSYLGGLIDDVSAVWNIDPNRIYFFGHSNGGYMSYRMACERADIAAIASLAGGTFIDADDCAPTDTVSILHIHGTLDGDVEYEGSATQPGAVGSGERWATYNGCAATRASGDQRLDIDYDVAGDETSLEWFESCPEGVGVELWTIEDGGHVPVLADDFPDLVWAWWQMHPQP
jgi:polyhydroxybutyrate depolymerase